VDTTSTIVALASGIGPANDASRAIIRLSGPQVPAICQHLFANQLRFAPDPTSHFARLCLSPNASLPVRLLLSSAPRSYTAQHTLEIILPAHDGLIAQLIAAIKAAPVDGVVRDAEPGEFSARAYLAGKLTLAQAEAVPAIIAASSAEQLASAHNLLLGISGQRYHAWTQAIARLLALTEAGIDFVDQDDVVAISDADLRQTLCTLSSQISSHLSAAQGQAIAPRELSVVLLGQPNAGKSTLFNALTQKTHLQSRDARPAIVSDQPGTTRDILCAPCQLSPAHTVLLCDMPGIDSALIDRAPSPTLANLERASQASALDVLRSAHIILYCDPFERWPILSPEPTDTARFIFIRTKADRYAPRNTSPPGATSSSVCHISALTAHGISALRSAILAKINALASKHSATASVLPRHARLLENVHNELSSALMHVTSSSDRPSALVPAHIPQTRELVAHDLRQALNHITELTGSISPDDILGRIFSTFCIGK
jgi:tRNA modification GTPase